MDYIIEPLIDKDDYNQCYNSFLEVYKANDRVIEQIKDVLFSLENKSNISVFLITNIDKLLSMIVSGEGSRFLLHVLRRGVHESLITEEPVLYVELSKLYARYNTYFESAEHYIIDPYRYVGFEFINSASYFKIVRADRNQLELKLDIPSFARFTSHVMDTFSDALEGSIEVLSKERIESLINSLENLRRIVGESTNGEHEESVE